MSSDDASTVSAPAAAPRAPRSPDAAARARQSHWFHYAATRKYGRMAALLSDMGGHQLGSGADAAAAALWLRVLGHPAAPPACPSWRTTPAWLLTAAAEARRVLTAAADAAPPAPVRAGRKRSAPEAQEAPEPHAPEAPPAAEPHAPDAPVQEAPPAAEPHAPDAPPPRKRGRPRKC